MKNQTNHYWNKDTDAKLVEYLAITDAYERDLFYEKHLYKPLDKIAEVWTNKIVSYADRREVQQDCLAHITALLHKIDLVKNKSAFSYINTSAKCFCILQNANEYTRRNRYVSMDAEDPDTDDGDKLETGVNNVLNHSQYVDFLSCILPDDFDFTRVKNGLIDELTKSRVFAATAHVKDDDLRAHYRNVLCRALVTLGSTHKFAKAGSKLYAHKQKKKIRLNGYLYDALQLLRPIASKYI